MNPVDFSELVNQSRLDGYRVRADKVIASYLRLPASNASTVERDTSERLSRALNERRQLISDLLVASYAIEELNTEIQSLLCQSWPVRMQQAVSPEIVVRNRSIVARIRLVRNELEDIATAIYDELSSTPQNSELGSPEEEIGSKPCHNRISSVPTREPIPAPAPALSTRAIVQINPYDKKGDYQSETLKRLSLLFDDVHYAMPYLWQVREELLGDPRAVNIDLAGLPKVLDPTRDLRPSVQLPIWMLPEKLRNTISGLEEHGILHQIDDEPLFSGEEQQIFNRIRNQVMRQDYSDPVFYGLSQTGADSMAIQLIPLSLSFTDEQGVPVDIDGRESTRILTAALPNVVLDSVEITSLLYLANTSSMSPVFLHPRHRAEIAHRYSQYQIGLQTLAEIATDLVSPSDFNTIFGEVTFGISNSVISSEVLANKSAADIARYRQALDPARRRFISEHLVEATALVRDNPWDRSTKVELERFIRGTLSTEMLKYQEESLRAWEKLFGTLTGSFGDIVRSALIGSGAGIASSFGGVVGNLIPNASPWDMILIGSLAGAVYQTPTIKKAIVERVIEGRQSKRSSIAYISEFQ